MIKNELTPEQRDEQIDKERKFYEKQTKSQQEFQLELAKLESSRKADPWPTLKSMAYAPCYLVGIVVVGTLAAFRRDIPQVLIDFLNS